MPVRRRPYRASRRPVTVRSTDPGVGDLFRTIRDDSRRKERSVSEFQGNEETAALEDEEAAMPMPDPAADQPSPGSMEDDESTWDDD